jgi:FtsP/CotA-like multicopper oxidase with cupredoxin domain
MDRRDFLKYGTASVASAALGLRPMDVAAQTACVPGAGTAPTFSLDVMDISADMIDGTRLNMIGFGQAPGPVLRVVEGARVRITVSNRRPEPHGFEITNIPEAKIEIGPGCSGTVSFTAPAAGTYVYHDGLRGPLHRVLGLHGVLVVEPLRGITPAGSRTPYSLDRLAEDEKRSVVALFDALGTAPRFPGGKWVPAPTDAAFSNQEKVWVLCEVDPRFNALVVPGQPIRQDKNLIGNVIDNWVPRYFTINNRSGFDLHEGDDVVIKNYIGEPTLLRVVNAGLAHHYNHFHGNDLMKLAGVELDATSPNFGRVVVQDNIFELDTHGLWPLDRVDLILPLEVPHDIPFRIPLSNPDPAASQFARMVAGKAQEPFPLRYVMHDHVEMSQTAGGGNYPQGMVTHWEILGGIGGRASAAAKVRGRTAAR